VIIDGKKFAQKLRNKIKKEIQSIKNKTKLTPGLTVILVGNHTTSEIYVRNKELSAKEVGISSKVLRFKSSISETKLISVIRKLNKDKKVHGILVQSPLTKFALPTAATTMSAFLHNSFKFFVLECPIVTVQSSFNNNCAMGLPFKLDLPMISALRPAKFFLTLLIIK